jgi:hypothetical protein
LTRALGAIISHLLTVLAEIILAKEDITAVDAEQSAYILTALLTRLKEITKVVVNECSIKRSGLGETKYRKNVP